MVDLGFEPARLPTLSPLCCAVQGLDRILLEGVWESLERRERERVGEVGAQILWSGLWGREMGLHG